MTLYRFDSYGRRIPPRNRPHWSLLVLLAAAVLAATSMAGDWWQAVKVLALLAGVALFGCWIAGVFKEDQ